MLSPAQNSSLAKRKSSFVHKPTITYLHKTGFFSQKRDSFKTAHDYVDDNENEDRKTLRLTILIDNGNNLLLSPLREGDGNKEDEQGDQGEEETSLTPTFACPGPPAKKERKKIWGKTKQKRRGGEGVGSGDQCYLK